MPLPAAGTGFAAASAPVGGSSEDMAKTIDAEYARRGAVIKAKNIRLD